MNYKKLRTWLADTLATVPGLEAYDRPPGAILTPCAYPQRVTTDPRSTFDDGERSTIEIALVVSRSDEASAWDAIDEYVTRNNRMSVLDVLEESEPDGFDSISVTQWEVVPDATVNDISYLAVVFTCEVLG